MTILQNCLRDFLIAVERLLKRAYSLSRNSAALITAKKSGHFNVQWQANF